MSHLYELSTLRKILKKLRKFNWIKVNIICLLDFFLKAVVFEIKNVKTWKMTTFSIWFFSRKLIIQSVQIKNENVRSILNDRILFYFDLYCYDGNVINNIIILIYIYIYTYIYQVYKLKSAVCCGINERTKLPWAHNTLFFVFDICQH